MTWALLLFLLTFALFVLPLIPALLELFWPTDTAPLKIVQAYDNNPMHFAEGFQKYINSNLEREGLPEIGMFTDGTDYQKVSEGGTPELNPSQRTKKLVIASHALKLQDKSRFESEVYSKTGIMTGIANQFRALFSNGPITIASGSTVWRWAHSDQDITVGDNAMLHGRVTSRKTMTIGIGTEFERLHAQKIVCGTEAVEPAMLPFIERTILEELPDVKSKAGRRSLLEGGLNFPEKTIFDGDIVAGSTAIVGDHSYIKGSIKSNAMNDILHYLHSTGAMTDKAKGSARCAIGDYVQIDGSVISTHDLYIGRHCRIYGPVIAENLLVIGSGTVIGSPQQPSTVTAPRIIIETGCVIHGTLFATQEGIIEDTFQSEEDIAV